MEHGEIIKDMQTLINYFQNERGAVPVCMEEAINIIRALDAAPAAPVAAEWKYEYVANDDAYFRRKWRCSACDRWTTYGAPAYCMHCGAKMKNGRA